MGRKPWPALQIKAIAIYYSFVMFTRQLNNSSA